jgi:outer membrane biogenesis lipoprotein LolB
MNKKQFLAAAFCLMALAGCTQKTELPENPKDQEEYRDHQASAIKQNAPA